jgi:regulation of enolase protein 1 (concanavalin A-like superfamily)
MSLFTASPLIVVLAAASRLLCFAQAPLVINGQDGTTIDGQMISSLEGPCITITNSTNVTIRASQIGPCGSHGVLISGVHNIKIVDNYIHPEVGTVIAGTAGCCDHGVGILASGTTNLLIQGNVIAWGETNISLNNISTATIKGNYLLNPQNNGSRGQQILGAGTGASNITVEGNYTHAEFTGAGIYKHPARQEDAINFESSRQDGSTNITVTSNYIWGGNSGSGCGIIADSGASNMKITHNTIRDTGQCGIGIADGSDHIVDGNKVINSTPIAGGGNTAIYVWKVHDTDPPCARITISNNVASELKPDGVTESGFWNGGGCEPVKLSGNIFNAQARALLLPVAEKLPVPLIPPQPYACVVASPFSNQPNMSPCRRATFNPAPQVSMTPKSDNFNARSLDTVVWKFVNSVGNGSYDMTGSQLQLIVPGRSKPDRTLQAVDNTVRVVQAASNKASFTVEAKFDSLPLGQYEVEGLLVEQDAAKCLRFQFASTGTSLIADVIRSSARYESSLARRVISIPAGSRSLWMRVQRAGSTWTQSWSVDGSRYNSAGSVTDTMRATNIGIFAGRWSSPLGVARAFTASIDYFANISSISPPQSGPTSDNFNGRALNTDLWMFINPVGNGGYALTGSHLLLTAPGGSNHDPVFGGANNAVRVVQPVGNADFIVEVKFESIPTLQYQFQGLIVEQDSANYLRFQIGSTGSALVVNASAILARNERPVAGSVISIPDRSTSLWMRVQRSGNSWTQTWSVDGVAYRTVGLFTQSLMVGNIGLFAGNYNGIASAAPAFTSAIDYFAEITMIAGPKSGSHRTASTSAR